MLLDPLVSLVEKFTKAVLALLQFLFQCHSHVLFHLTQPRLQQQQLTAWNNSSETERL